MKIVVKDASKPTEIEVKVGFIAKVLSEIERRRNKNDRLGFNKNV